MMLRQRALIAGPARTTVVLEPQRAVCRLSWSPSFCPSLPGRRACSGVDGRLATDRSARYRAGIPAGCPDVFLIVCFVVLLPMVLFEQRSPYAAVMRSVQLVRPLWGKVCAALVIAMLIVVVCVLVAAVLCIGCCRRLAGNGAAVEAIANALVLAVLAVVAGFLERALPGASLGREQLGLIFLLQGVQQLVEPPLHDLGQAIERQLMRWSVTRPCGKL